jgi:hypothetical protein
LFVNNVNKHWKIRKEQSKMDNPEKLATYGTQDEEKQNKNTTQPRETGNIWYTRRRKTKQICVGHHYTPEGIISTLDDLSCVYLQAWIVCLFFSLLMYGGYIWF